MGDAVVRALAQNPNVQIANLKLAEAQQDAAAARAGLLPRASLQTFQETQRYNIETVMGQRLPGVSQHIGPFQVVSSAAVFSAPVLDVSLWKRFRAAGARTLAEKADEKTMREQTALLVVSQYLAALRARARVTAAESRRDLAQALLEQTDALRVNGIATRVDLLRADVRLKQEQQTLLVAETEVRTTLYGLSRLLNLAPEDAVQLEDEEQFFQTPEIAVESTVEAAFANRPELGAQHYRELAAELDRSLAAAKSLPSLQFQGWWGEHGRNFSGTVPDYTYQFTLTVPLFTGGELTAERRRAALVEAETRQQTTETRNRIVEEVKSSRADIESAKSQVDVARQALQLAQEELELARGRFAAGVTDNIEVVSAQSSLATANDNQIDALYRFNEARAVLAGAVGQVEATYVRSK